MPALGVPWHLLHNEPHLLLSCYFAWVFILVNQKSLGNEGEASTRLPGDWIVPCPVLFLKVSLALSETNVRM
jgi:hypothetical protein